MLVILAVLSLLVFAVPYRFKFWFTLLVILLGAVVSCAETVSLFISPMDRIVYGNNYNALFLFDFPVMDLLSALFVVITSIAAVSVTFYAKGYVAAYEDRKSPVQISLHYAALALMYFSMVSVVMFRGGFAFLFAWELMTITSFILVLFEGEKREVRRAAINYLVLMHIGFVFILSGFIIGSGEGELTGFDALGAYFATHNPLPLFLVFFVGFGMKAGIFPLHVWLPEAHPSAPSHVSALMSGIMVKMGVYGILRVLTYIQTDLYTIGIVVLCVGVVTGLWGIIFASLQNDLKKLLAYSTIENVGIIFMGVGIGVIGRAVGNETLFLLGMSGALLHVVNHSFFKPMLFMNAGSVYLATHTRNIDELGGLSRRMPVTTTLFLVGALAICALPPFNGFVSEFLIYLGLLKSIADGTTVLWSIFSIAALSLIGGLAVLVFTKAFGVGFLGVPRTAKAEHVREVAPIMLCAQTLPLAGILLVGLFPAYAAKAVSAVVLHAFGSGEPVGATDILPFAGSLNIMTWVVLLLIFVSVAIYFLKTRAMMKRPVAESPTWGCGFTAPTDRMQYTGESFSEGVQRLTASLTNDASARNKKGGEISKDEIFAVKHDFGVRRQDRIDKLVASRWVYLVRKMNARLALFQTGKINHYVLHALLFLALVFLLTLTGVI